MTLFAHEMPFSSAPEPAFEAQVKSTIETVEREVATSQRLSVRPEDFQELHGHQIPILAEQKDEILPEVSGAQLVARIPADERLALGTLQIGPDERVTLSFAGQCFQRGRDGRLHYAPEAVTLIVGTKFTNENREDRSYQLILDHQTPEGAVSTSFYDYAEMGHDSIPEPDATELDEFTIFMSMASQPPISEVHSDVEGDASAELDRELIGTTENGRDLRSEEVAAMGIVARYFSAEPQLPQQR